MVGSKERNERSERTFPYILRFWRCRSRSSVPKMLTWGLNWVWA